MQILPPHLHEEEFYYHSPKSAAELRADISAQLEKADGWDFSVNLAGEFISESEFEMRPRWSLLYTGGKQREAILKGTILVDELKRANIIFSVKPVHLFTLWFYAAVILLIAALFVGLFQSDEYLDAFIVLVLAVGLAYLPLRLAQTAKVKLKKRFVAVFALIPVE